MDWGFMRTVGSIAVSLIQKRGRCRPARTAIAAAFIALIASSSASAAVTLGQTYTGGSGGEACGSSSSYFQTNTVGGPPTEMPSDGVVTSWSSAGFQPVTKLKIARLAGGTQFTVIGEDGPKTYLGSGVQTYPVRIPVRQGDVLGIYVPGSHLCPYPVLSGTSSLRYLSGDQAVGSGSHTFGGSYANLRLPISAQLEADADGDGYGDETQDGCPTLASVQGPCPLPDTAAPETAIDKGPGKKTKWKTANFQFSSSEAGSTFECSLDGATFSPCTSPKSVKVKPGKHNFLVRARDVAGNLDTTEAGYSWKVVKKKRKKHGH